MPAQSSGAAPARSEVCGNAQHESLVDDNAVGVPAVGDAAGVLVGRVVGESAVLAELLKTSLALGTGAVGIHQASNPGQIAGLESS